MDIKALLAGVITILAICIATLFFESAAKTTSQDAIAGILLFFFIYFAIYILDRIIEGK